MKKSKEQKNEEGVPCSAFMLKKWKWKKKETQERSSVVKSYLDLIFFKNISSIILMQ